MKKWFWIVLALLCIDTVCLALVKSESLPWSQQEAHWIRWDKRNMDPEWDKFKENHPEYEYHEMEVWRGNQRSVVRFYKNKQGRWTRP